MNSFGDNSADKREPKGKRGAQKEETRARILGVARVHFERDGFDAASIRAIAKDAEVATGTVLLHYKDKRDLLHAALFDDLARTIDAALAELPDEGATDAGAGGEELSLEARLLAIARPFFAYYAGHPKLTKTLLREALLAESPWRERFTAQTARVHVQVAGLAAKAKARGELASHVDPVVFGASFFAFYYFALIGWVQGALSEPAPLFQRMLGEHIRGLSPATDNGRRP